MNMSIQDISTTHRDAILHQASLPKAVWDVALDVMNAFEKVKLKDQRLKVLLRYQSQSLSNNIWLLSDL